MKKYSATKISYFDNIFKLNSKNECNNKDVILHILDYIYCIYNLDNNNLEQKSKTIINLKRTNKYFYKIISQRYSNLNIQKYDIATILKTADHIKLGLFLSNNFKLYSQCRNDYFRWVCISGSINIVKFILSKFKKHNFIWLEGFSIACDYKYNELASFIIVKNKINKITLSSFLLNICLYQNCDIEVVQLNILYIKKCYENNKNNDLINLFEDCFMSCFYFRYTNICYLLIEHGVDLINIVNLHPEIMYSQGSDLQYLIELGFDYSTYKKN